jgi:lipoprotein Spr
VGIYLENNKFIHASTTKGVIVGDLNNEFTRKKIVGAGRVKKK